MLMDNGKNLVLMMKKFMNVMDLFIIYNVLIIVQIR